jgi:methionyl-tRNA formyltransferase
MKIGYFADGPWSHRALEKITSDNRFDIAFIVPRYDSQDPILKKWASQLSIDYIPIENVNRAESIAQLKKYSADLYVSMSFNQILKKEILNSAPSGFINSHAGALPFYRGRNILNWALINDENKFGVTVHYIDEGIDTGDIILQRMEPITDRDDYSTLLERAIEVCADLLFESLILIYDDNVKRLPQKSIDPVGMYCRRRRQGDEWINWSWPSRRIFNFIRAITEPGPCAMTMLDDNEVTIQKAKMVSGAREYIGVPGEILGVSKEGVTVKTGDTFICVESFKYGPLKNKFRIGQRFSSL